MAGHPFPVSSTYKLTSGREDQPMRQATLATLALAAAGFVMLAVPHAARSADLDGALLITCSGSSDEGGMTECPVDLVKGRDYDFHAQETNGGGLVELVNPVGQTTISFPGPGD